MNEHHWDFSSAAALMSQRSIIDVNELDWKAVPAFESYRATSARSVFLSYGIGGR